MKFTPFQRPALPTFASSLLYYNRLEPGLLASARFTLFYLTGAWPPEPLFGFISIHFSSTRQRLCIY